MVSVAFSRNLFLSSICVVYLFAYVSLYVQIPGLYGDYGLLPAKLVVNEAASLSEFLAEPSLLRLSSSVGLSVEQMMEFLCAAGVVLSVAALLSQRLRNSFVFFLLWLMYYSLFKAGQTFLWFQWDILLLETGFLVILVAPLNIPGTKSDRPHDSITYWLVKWLLFRLMFASGVVKLTSGCPTWWGLTALNYHYETQCIPTSFAWFVHQLPEWYHKLSVVQVYLIELPLPFLFFSPVRSQRIVSFYAQVYLMVAIYLTGNYNFFNILTVVLCLPLLDDDWFYSWNRKREKQVSKTITTTTTTTTTTDNKNSGKSATKGSSSAKKTTSTSKTSASVTSTSSSVSTSDVTTDQSNRYVEVMTFVLRLAGNILVYGALVCYTVKLCSIQIDLTNYRIESKIAFTYKEFTSFLKTAVPITIAMGLVSLCWEILKALYRSLTQSGSTRCKMTDVCGCLLFGAVAIAMFSISTVEYTVIDDDSHQSVWPSVRQLHSQTRHLEITGSYGLFRRMTGVEGRPEVIVEGSNEVESGWKEYKFYYKPGDVTRAPPIVAPHQPRLDWQMWFASLGTYQGNLWFVNMVYRLLNNQKEVLELIEYNPFPDSPPKYIRADLYHYHFTSSNKSSERFSDVNWWHRTKVKEYLPVTVAEHLTDYLKWAKIYEEPGSKPVEKEYNFLGRLLLVLRQTIGQRNGFLLCVSLFLSCLVVQVSRSLLGRKQTDA